MTAHVLTLVAAAEPLDPDLIETVRATLSRLGALVDRPVWLDEPRACDICFDELNDDQADAAAREVVGTRAIDCFAQATEGRRKRLLLADMESTLIENELLDDLAAAAGVGVRVAEITARAMNGELDFTQALEARVSLLAGFDAGVLTEIAAGIRYMPGAKALVATMARHGAATAIVSGGFDIFTARVAEALGVDTHQGNRLDIAEGRLTGKVVPPVLTRESKYKALVAGAAARELPLSATLAVGDGANDLDMIAAAGLGVAYHAKPIVTARAKWRIDHADLTALLYAQGYRAGEIVRA